MAWAALTRMTFADTVRQPVTWLMTAVSLALIALSYCFGMFNFEALDRLRMLATAGVAVGVINGLFLAVVLATQSVHDELASRTALTLFAKPLGRGEFIVGKTLGVWLTVAVSGLVIAAGHVLALVWAWHTGFEDAIDNDEGSFFDSELRVPWLAVASAHGLALGHSAVLASMAAVLALRLGLVANILVCFGVFLLGHLLPSLGLMGGGITPALAVFNIDDCIQLDLPVSGAYLAMTVLYTACFCAGCLSIGLAVFRRQDIP
jgi:ABC-type transport system involved in multi-copper enzyme maturation permease subunit